ncbi:MAG TPA: hypothetical protein VI566_12055 [Xanthomonadales bacterium]|nr:hypothetical protein [Xanthomonadales bacterium]
MSKVHSAGIRALHPHTVFRAFKYLIYCLLVLNALLFFQEDYLASREVFGNQLTWSNLVEGYSATIDTIAWVALLLLFELETAVIPDEKLQGGLKWLLMAVRVGSYSFILWAFYGYLTKYGVVADNLPFTVDDVCSLVGSGFTWVQDLDQYPAIDQASCRALQGQPLLQISGTQIIGTVQAVEAARNLTLVDIVNAADWLVIVVMLEVEVYLQLRELLSDRMLLIIKLTKGLLYSILLVCAIYWGLLGDFLDFWDAFLWLVAFVFIEMNIFQWHEAIEEERAEEEHAEEQEEGGAAAHASG